VLALSLKVPSPSLRHSLRIAERARPEQQALERSMKVLSACAPYNPLARRFFAILKYYQQLLAARGEIGTAVAEQVDGYELSSTTNPLPPTPLSVRDPDTAITDSVHSSRPMSLDGQPRTVSRSQRFSTDVCPVPVLNNPAIHELGQRIRADPSPPPASNPAWGDWATTSLGHGSTYPEELDATWHSNPFFKQCSFRSAFTQP
jgi:hypothetical protein